MAQVKRQDSLGTLSDLGSSVRLSDARITIGGRQYQITQLDQAYPALSNDTTYRVDVTAVSETPAIVISETEPGTAYKQVGEIVVDGSGGKTFTESSEGFFPIATTSTTGVAYKDFEPVTKTLSSDFAGTSPATEMVDLRHTGLIAGDKYRVDITLLNNGTQSHIWVAWGDRSDNSKYRYHRMPIQNISYTCTFEFISDGNDLRIYGGPSGSGFTAQDGNDTPTELTDGFPKVSSCTLTRVKS